MTEADDVDPKGQTGVLPSGNCFAILIDVALCYEQFPMHENKSSLPGASAINDAWDREGLCIERIIREQIRLSSDLFLCDLTPFAVYLLCAILSIGTDTDVIGLIFL